MMASGRGSCSRGCRDLPDDEIARGLTFFVRDRRPSLEVILGRSEFRNNSG